MGNQFGNLQGMGRGSNVDGYKKRKQSERGYYKFAFVENYVKLTERDVELRSEYAKDAIGRYLGVPKQMITFRRKSTKQTTVSLDEIFYVKVGVETVGKVSLRVLRTFSYSNMDIIYQEKRLQVQEGRKYNLMRGIKGQTKGFKRAQRKKNKRKDKMTR